MRLAFILLGAAGLWYYTQAQKFVNALQYALHGVAFNGINANIVSLTVKMRLINPTGFACPVMGVNLLLSCNSVALARVNGNAFNIPPNGYVDVQLPTTVNLANVPAAIAQALTTSSVAIRTTGRVTLNPLVSVPVDATTGLV